jgi:hypothetical protein
VASVIHETNLRSVTWTKVSLKEAKIRATPKTISPVTNKVNNSEFTIAFGAQTFANLRAEGDILRGGAFDLLFGRHFELPLTGLCTTRER